MPTERNTRENWRTHVRQPEWTKEHDQILVQCYSIECASERLCKLLNRTRFSIQTRAGMLGLKCRKCWTEEETSILKIHFRDMDTLIKMLPNKTPSAIRVRIRKLKLNSNKWSKEDLAILLSEYSKEGPSVRLQTLLKRSKQALSAQFCAYRTNETKRFPTKLINFRGYEEISATYFNRVIEAAKERGLDFNVTIEWVWNLYLKQERKCALSGLDIVFYTSSRKRSEQTASLDRIDSSKGYIEGNLQWVHKHINLMKGQAPQGDFIRYCKAIALTHSLKDFSNEISPTEIHSPYPLHKAVP